MKVIVISGHAQHGKDTTAGFIKEILEEEGDVVLITHYADLLKYICKAYFGWDGKKDEAGRKLLQFVGTDIVRKKYPDFWVDFMLIVLKLFENQWDYVLIPDTRFPNEIDDIFTYFDGWHLRVERPGFASPLTPEQQKHPSETALDNVKPDYTICNDGTLEDLRATVKTTLKEVLNA